MGHLANLVKQLCHSLLDIRIMMIEHQTDGGACNFRRCPHCGMVWQKHFGCDGETTCGAEHERDELDGGRTKMTKWAFTFAHGRLADAERTVQVDIKTDWTRKSKYGKGCGRSINWSTMSTVQDSDKIGDGSITFAEFMKGMKDVSEPNTNDIPLVIAEQIGSFDALLRDGYRGIKKLEPIFSTLWGAISAPFTRDWGAASGHTTLLCGHIDSAERSNEPIYAQH